MGFKIRSTNPGDVLPPTVPETVTSAVTGPTSITVSWTASTDVSGVARYDVELAPGITAEVFPPDLSHTFSGLPLGVSYTPRVRAVDVHGTPSLRRNGFSISIPNTPPGPTLDADASWLVRSRAPGVFWACNGEEFVRGIPGYTSQPVFGHPTGIEGRKITAVNSIADHPGIEERPIDPAKYNGNWPDGHGMWKHTEYPNVSGKVMHVRHGAMYSDGGEDWSVLPWAYAPVNFADTDTGTGLPNQRHGIPGTVGEGAILPYVETRLDNPAQVSVYNRSNRPVVRHHFCQFLLCAIEDWYTYCHRTWFTPEHNTALVDWAVGVSKKDRDNKIFFPTGGQHPDQFALKLDHGMIITVMGYRGSSQTVGYSKRVTAKGGERINFSHPAIDTGSHGVTLDSKARAEDWMRRYGMSVDALVYGQGTYPDGVNRAQPKFEWRHPGLPGNYIQNNSLTNPANNHPHGGLPVDGRDPWPDLNYPRECSAGFLRRSVPMVITYMISDQISANVNDDRTHGATGDGSPTYDQTKFGPRITALWASKLGDPPTLLGYVGSNGQPPGMGGNQTNGPGMIPSRFSHASGGPNSTTIDGDVASLYKVQENAVFEGRGNCGYMIVGAMDGYPEPTNTVFYALRANPVGDLEGNYHGAETNKAVDPGAVENFGGGCGMGWARGALRFLDPAPPGARSQFWIQSTQYTGASITVPNAYRNDLAPVTAHVHRFELQTPTSVVPRARSVNYVGDCINVLFSQESTRPYGRQVGYGEVIYGFKWIPWPYHENVPMPWPALYT